MNTEKFTFSPTPCFDLIIQGCLNVNVNAPCCLDECSIIPLRSNHAYSTFRTHTIDDCRRVVVLDYQAGPALGNDPVTSEPNRYDIYCDGVLIASTNGWVGGTKYENDPLYQPFVGGPIGTISGIKPRNITSISVFVGGDSASVYDISCY